MPACSLLALAAVAVPRDLSGYTHQQYAAEFRKQYGAAEAVRRAAVFEANLEEIRAHNADSSATWYAAVNQFTDLTQEEFRARITGTGPAPAQVSARKHVRSPGDLPVSVDWRTKDGVVTPVKDQASCGSCWAFSATETFESQVAIATGKPAPVLSEQQVISCAPNPDRCGGTGGCSGSTQQLAFNYTKTVGMMLEADWAYAAKTGTCDKTITPVATNTGYTTLESNNYADLVDAVANVGPIAITVDAGGWKSYGGGVSDAKGFMLNHGVQLVGYGTDADNGDYWLVRNSWGTSFGEGGYIRLARLGDGKEPCGTDYLPSMGIACKGDIKPKKYCGTSGILSSSSYPTGVKGV